jgi:hypothetical protein
MNLTLTGKTFNHRIEIQRLGGRWNASNKSWTISNASAETAAACRAMVGVNVVGLPADQNPTAPPMPNRAPVPAAEPLVVPFNKDETVVSGNDDTFLGRFSIARPNQFVGFDNFNSMIDYVDALDMNDVPDEQDRRYGWIGAPVKWYGTPSMQAAIELARTGWAEGVDKAKEALAIIDSDHATARKPVYDVAGGRVNVGRMLSGSPTHMTRRTRQPAKKVITLFSNFRLSADIDPDAAIIRAAVIAAIADILEMSGYSCEIVGYKFNVGVASSGTVQHVVTLKKAGETLNLNDIVFALGHPSMTRRFSLAMSGIELNLAKFCYRGFGRAHETPFDNLSSTEFNLAPVPSDFEFGETFADSVREMFPLIVPDNFPVNLKGLEL